MEGKFGVCGETTQHSEVVGREVNVDRVHYFDQPTPAPDRTYRIKITWNGTGLYRVWIDHVAMEVNGSCDIQMRSHVDAGEFRGFDAIYLHPGFATSRETLAEKSAGKRFFGGLGPLTEPHRAYWGRFRVRSY
jgi:hypothetical protein